MGKVYDQICMFKAKYPGTIAWRLKKHSHVIEEHLSEGEEPLYSFAGQKNNEMTEIFNTYVLCVTNKRLLLAQDHLIGGYTIISITPDMFNDLTAFSGILFGKIIIDTVKEVVIFTNLAKKSLPEIENAISTNMMEQKQKYVIQNQLPR